MVDKLVKGIDEDVWRKFVAFCKLKNNNVGNELNKLLEEYLEENFNMLLKKTR